MQQGWIRQGWLQEQLSDAAAVERDGFFLLTCLHLELWLQAIQAQR